jgi:hypothetical protein
LIKFDYHLGIETPEPTMPRPTIESILRITLPRRHVGSVAQRLSTRAIILASIAALRG